MAILTYRQLYMAFQDDGRAQKFRDNLNHLLYKDCEY